MSRSFLVRLRRPALAVGATALALGGLTACGGDDEKTVDLGDGTKASVKKDGDDVTITSDEGEIKTGNDVELPDEFPSDLPMPQGDHTVVSSIDSNGELMVTLQADDLDLPAEREHLKTELGNAGWEVSQDSIVDQAEMAMVAVDASKDDVEASYALTTNEGQPATVIIIVRPGDPVDQ